MTWFAAKSGKRGRSQTFAIQFCLSIKCLFGLPLWQSLGRVESLLNQAGLDWPVPDFSTVSRRQKTLNVVSPYRTSCERLYLLVDSTGIKMLGERVMARDFDRQVAELHIRAALLNRFTLLGTPETERVA